MTANSVFNAYLDANIIIVAAAILWALVRFILGRTALRQAFLTQLHLVYGVLLAIALSPLVIVAFNLMQGVGIIGTSLSPSLSDYALAQFLNGHIQMSPTKFETLWMSRMVFTRDVVTLGSPLGMAVAGMLGLGITVFTVLVLRNAWHIRCLIARAYLWRRIGKIDVVLTDRCDVPFSTRGVTRRYIVLPTGLLAQSDDLRIAIAHELQHMRQGDLGWEIALEFVRPFFFWNPAWVYFKRQVEELRELACDQQVLMRRRVGIREYCDCLLRVCQNQLDRAGARRILVPTVPLVSPEASRRADRVLKRRVLSMVSKGRLMPGRWATGLLALPLLGVISFGSLATQSSSGDWSQDRLMLSTIVNLERLDQRSPANRY